MPNYAKLTRSTAIVSMRYQDAPAAIEWLCDAFGFERKLVVPGEDGAIAHAELTFGNGMVMLGSARGGDYDRYVGPVEAGGRCTQSGYFIVTDIDAHHARAVAAGAEILTPLQDEDHGREYSCRDPQGQVWNFGTYDPWEAS